MADEHFCPVVLRKGTVYGWSPRMRFDLVVNTFLKDALTRGRITIHYGGEMWRPLVDVRDAARAYIACLEADDDKVRGQIFNVIYRNMRISELALRVKDALAENGVQDRGRARLRLHRRAQLPRLGAQDRRGARLPAGGDIEESVANALEKLRGLQPVGARGPALLQHPLAQAARGGRDRARRAGGAVRHSGARRARGHRAAAARRELSERLEGGGCQVGGCPTSDPWASWSRARWRRGAAGC